MATNPFINRIVFSNKDDIRILLMSIFIAPIRLICLFIALVIGYILTCVIFMIDDDMQHPLIGARLVLKKIVNKFIIWAHIVFAGFKITVNGNRAPSHEAPILTLAPHTSFFDLLPYCVIGAPSVVGKKGLFEAPIIGKLLYLTIPVIVDRDDKYARQKAQETIRTRAKCIFDKKLYNGAEWPQVAIFPEGTCTNATQLITFRKGAFHPRLPVQPVCFQWKCNSESMNTTSWTWEGANCFSLFWLTLCSWTNELEVTYLPVHVPSVDEKLDVYLFARNVRKEMAEHLNLPVSEYTLDDVPYLTSYHKPCLKEFWRLCEKVGIAYHNEPIEHIVRTTTDLSTRGIPNPFFMTFDRFAIFLALPPDYNLQRLFNAFDWQSLKQIDIREYLATFLSKSARDDKKYLDTVCSVFEPDTRGINEENLVKILRFPFEISVADCKAFCSMLSLKGERITSDKIFEMLKDRGLLLPAAAKSGH